MRLWLLLVISAACVGAQPAVTFLKPAGGEAPAAPKIACGALYALTGFEFTIESAAVAPAEGDTPEFCRVMGQILRIREGVRVGLISNQASRPVSATPPEL